MKKIITLECEEDLYQDLSDIAEGADTPIETMVIDLLKHFVDTVECVCEDCEFNQEYDEEANQEKKPESIH